MTQRSTQHSSRFNVKKKEKSFFEENLKANTANPKKLWETIKQLGLLNKRFPSSDIYLKENLIFDYSIISNVFWKLSFIHLHGFQLLVQLL